jgi:type IV fimbrial biogenesis protein FimT
MECFMDTRLPVAGRSAGFTLIEAMIILALSTILLGIAVPSFRYLLANNAMTTARNSVVTHLHLARSEAVKRGITTVLCPSFDGLGCLKGYEWDGGFMLFSDSNNNRIYDKGELLLQFKQHDFGNIRVFTSAGRKRIAYKADGSAAGYNATFTFCDRGEQVSPRAVLLANSGRPRLSDTRSNGAPLDCDG